MRSRAFAAVSGNLRILGEPIMAWALESTAVEHHTLALKSGGIANHDKPGFHHPMEA